jgi:DNA-binding PadR family transcriptional regulator
MHGYNQRGGERFGFWFMGGPGRRFGGGFGPRGFGAPGFGRHGSGFGRRLGSEELQLIILALLEERPCHGYELIKRLEERSGGFYSPSPGMIYPALTYLEELGYATVAPEGAKKLYSITETGREHLGRNRATAEAILKRFEKIGGRMEDVRRAFAGEAYDEDDTSENARLRNARRMLKQAFSLIENPSHEQIERVIEVLLNAAGEITRIAKEQ